MCLPRPPRRVAGLAGAAGGRDERRREAARKGREALFSLMAREKAARATARRRALACAQRRLAKRFAGSLDGALLAAVDRQARAIAPPPSAPLPSLPA